VPVWVCRSIGLLGFSVCLFDVDWQCDDVAEGSQTSAERANVRAKYPESQLYVVTQNVTATQEMDLPLVKGCVVAVIKENDPMGNRDHWFVNNGGPFLQTNYCVILRRFILASVCFFLDLQPDLLLSL